MATFDTLESSRQDSRPIEVYRIAIGTEAPYLYTSAEDEITLGSEVFTPVAIARSEVSQGEDERKRVLTLVLPGANAFAQRYVETPPGQKATVTIIRLQRDETPTFFTQELVYKGSVQSVQFPDAGEVAQISVQSIEAATSRRIPRFRFMGMCNHIVYSAACGADPVAHSIIGATASVAGNVITVAGVDASGHDFVGGYCKPTAEADFRLIIAQSVDSLTLLIPFASEIVGANMQLFAGCDHKIEGDCALVFDRVNDYGGFAFVPSKNPFATGID